MAKEEEMRCARCGGDYKVVESCASSPDAPSCSYCREFFICQMNLERIREHLYNITDWLYDDYPAVIGEFFYGKRHDG